MLDRLGYILARHRLQFFYVLLFSVLLNSLFAAADPLITKRLLDEVVRRNFGTFATLAVVIVLFGVLVRLGFWAHDLLAQRLKNNVAESLSLRMLHAYYGLGYLETRRNDSGYFLSRVYEEPAKIAQGAVTTWMGVIVQAMTFLAAGGVAVYLSGRLTLLLSIIVPLLYYLANRFKPRIKQVSKEENEEEARLRDVLSSAVSAYTTVRVFALQVPVSAHVQQRLQSFLRVLYSRVKTARTYQTASNICLSFSEAAVLLAAGYAVVQGSLTIGGLFGFMSAFWKLIGAANGIISQLPELHKLDGYIDRLKEFEGSVRVGDEEEFDRVEITQAAVSYHGPEVLSGVDLSIGKGESLVVVGPNGCGKSTLAYLITGLLQPSRGTVRAPSLPQVSALLTPFHFVPGTLKDNVDYARLDDDKRRLFWEWADTLSLLDKVDQEPAFQYSEGQKRKAQILMTLLKDADLYLFDEPFANVDSESKEKILNLILERARGKILVAVLHGDEKFYPLFERVVYLPGRSAEPSSDPAEVEQQGSVLG